MAGERCRTPRVSGMIRKRYEDLKPGDVFKLSDGRTYVLVADVKRGSGTMVTVNG